jgi:hypothetical protein
MNYQEKCEWLSEFYREAAETGREMQYKCHDSGWAAQKQGPNAISDPENWRLKPEPQKAWVVWLSDGQSAKFDSISEARIWSQRNKGEVIQEITRPDIAKAEGRGE